MPGDINYKTKCGLYVRDEVFTISISENIYYLGEKHICTPCRLKECHECSHVLFSSFGSPIVCALDKAESFNYEKSLNKILNEYKKNFYKERDKIQGSQWQKCPNIVQRFDKAVKRFIISECRRLNCMNKVCVITGQERNTELVNIFYDLKHIEERGFLKFEEWEKGLKYFNTRVARDIAERYIPQIKKNEPEKLNLRIQARATRNLEEELERLKVNMEV